MSGDWSCGECSEDYGPCESHCEVLAQRDGAHSRTADELALCFISDARALGACMSRTGELDLESLVWEGSWLAEGHSDVLYELSNQIEQDLYSVDGGPFSIVWDDGYIISRITGGPLLDHWG